MSGQKNPLYLLSIQGPDRPGITSGLMNIIKQGDNKVFDIGQSVTLGLLSLSIVVEIPSEKKDEVLKELLFVCKEKNVELNFKEVSADNIKAVKGERYVLSCISATPISANFIGEIAETLSDQKINIDRIDNFEEIPLKSLDIATTPIDNIDWHAVKQKLVKISNKHKIDIAFVKDDVFRFNKRLVVFDMDSTLIQAEVIDELAAEFGVKDQVSAITERAMNGEMDFNESLIQRVSLLEGLTVDALEKVKERIKLSEGVEEFVRAIKTLGFKTAVISGGFDYFANSLKDHLALDYAFANKLEIADGKLTGKVIPPIVNGEHKSFLLNFITQQEGIALEQVVAIGDGANDLPMLAEAGMGIAYQAKERVKLAADQRLSHGPMTSILYFFGISRQKEF